MANPLVGMIFTTIFNKVLDRITEPDVPVDNRQASDVAREVAKTVTPMVVNANNAEPWYKSRIYLGLLVAAIGMIGERFGFILPGEEIDPIVTFILMAMEVIGLGYATYGRLVGAQKKPLFE